MNKKLKYTKILYFDNKNNDWKLHSVSSVFSLAIVNICPHGCFPLPCKHGEKYKDHRGINIGIAIPHENKKDGDDFEQRIFNSWDDLKLPQTIYLIGSDSIMDIRIPVRISAGNSYSPEMGTSCLFGYITPEIVGPDSPPKMRYDNCKDYQRVYKEDFL